jgi:hypothetical protein
VIEISNRSMLMKLSNTPKVFDLLTKLSVHEIDSFKALLNWSPTLITNVVKYNYNVFDLLLKISSDDIQHVKTLFSWPTSFISQILKNTESVVGLMNKLLDSDKDKIKIIADWSSTLTAVISKDLTILEFLIKLSDQDKIDLLRIFNCSISTISLIRHKGDIFEFVNSLEDYEIELFQQLVMWSPSTIGLLYNQDKTLDKNYKTHIMSLYKIWDMINDQEQFFKSYMALTRAAEHTPYDVTDAFSRGQLDSKIWLINELDKLSLDLGNVWTLCGWVGTISYLMTNSTNNLNFTHVRSFDIDPRCAPLADLFNKKDVLNSWKFKASTLDVNSMHFNDYKFATLKSDGSTQYIQESATTVVNTSCDHMSHDIWWERIPVGTLVVLQNNNFEHVQEHVNIVSSLTEFKQRYPMTTTLYAGELECDLYTRYMLIGRK